MTRYHINSKTGNPGACSAAPGNCPFGDESNHFGSEAEARTEFEARNKLQTVSAPVKKAGVRLENRAAKHTPGTTWGALPTKVSDEELKNASAYAVVNNKFSGVTYESVAVDGRFDNLSEYDGNDWQEQARKHYLIATPEGGFIKVDYVAAVDAQHDDYWEFYPQLEADYSYYPNLASFKSGEPSTKGKQDIDLDSIARYTEGNYNRLSFDHGSDTETIRIAKRAINELPDPHTIAKLAHVRSFEGKMNVAELTGDKYLGNKDEKVRASSVVRKELPTSAHERALADPSMRVQAALATRPDLQKEHLEALLAMDKKTDWQYSGDTPRQSALKNPKLPLRIMSKAAREGTIEDMRALNRNSGLNPKAREVLDKRAQQLGIRL